MNLLVINSLLILALLILAAFCALGLQDTHDHIDHGGKR